MVKSLDQLRKEKKALLQKSNAKKTLMANNQRDMLERQKLEAEIKALKNPGSTRAKNVAGSLGMKTGRLLLKGSKALGRHLGNLARDQREAERKQSKRGNRRR